MQQDPQTLGEEEFLGRLRDSSTAGTVRVRLGNGAISLRVKQTSTPALIFTFAGSVNRAKQQPPLFGATRLSDHIDASVIGIADPSLEINDELTVAWYAGHEGLELQQLLPPFLGRVAGACGAERVVFVGGSAGGFAALYYSWCFPGSVALTTNPQTNLERYNEQQRVRYRAVCRPSLPADVSINEVVCSNAVNAYKEKFENTVVYLQVADDLFHVKNHFAPFLAGVPLATQHRLIARLNYWGESGHAAVPPAEWLGWLRAIVSSPTSSAKDIQSTMSQTASFDQEDTPPLTAAPNEDDFRFASRLTEAAWQEINGIERAEDEA